MSAPQTAPTYHLDVAALTAVPQVLKERAQWVLWNYELRKPTDKKLTKVPYRADGRGFAESDNPETWATFDAAVTAFKRPAGKWSGIGFVFREDGGLVGVDLDDSLDVAGNLLPWAALILNQIGGEQTYGERSPSGGGVKLIGLGKLPEDGKGKNKKGFGPDKTGGVEVYEKGRFFTITGEKFYACGSDLGRYDPDGLDALYEVLCTPTRSPSSVATHEHRHGVNGHEDRLERCWAYVQRCPDAISGDNGHKKALRAACETVRFDLGRGEQFEVMRRFSASKSGGEPWSDREIEHKLDDAEKEAGHERGIRLRERSPAATGTNGQRINGHPVGGPQGNDEEPASAIEDLQPVPLGDMWNSDPNLREPIIDGLLRRGQVGNLISTSKSYKTYLILNLAIAVAEGRTWLERFPTTRGKVLLIDLELQKPDITRRTRDIAGEMHADLKEVAAGVVVLALRGRNVTIDQLEPMLLKIEPRTYSFVIIDPLYKTYPPDFDENSNPRMTWLYRRFERIAEHLDAGMVVVHHASKGSQSEKTVIDVGAGAGAQARSPDGHMVLRPHEADDAIVFEAAVRSFPPVDPLVLVWNYPLWRRDTTLDPKALKTGRRGRNTDKPQPQPKPPKPEWNPDKFAATFVTNAPQAKDVILSRAARADGLSAHKARGLLAEAVAERRVFRHTFMGDNKAYFSNVEQTLLDVAEGSVCVTNVPPHPPVGGNTATGAGQGLTDRSSGTAPTRTRTSRKPKGEVAPGAPQPLADD